MKTSPKASRGAIFAKYSLVHGARKLVILVSGLVVCAGAQAALITTGTSDNSTAFPVSATDLVDSSQSTLLSQTPTGTTTLPSFNAPQSTYGQLNDGITGGSFAEGVSNGANPYTVTFTLDTSVNTFGYDITGVNTFAASYGFAGIGYQDYELLYSVVGNASFTSLGSFVFNSTNDYYTKIAITSDSGPIASGVDEIRFIIEAPTANGTGLTELDVIGAATVPEPSITAMFAFAGIGLFFLARKRTLSASR